MPIIRSDSFSSTSSSSSSTSSSSVEVLGPEFHHICHCSFYHHVNSILEFFNLGLSSSEIRPFFTTVTPELSIFSHCFAKEIHLQAFHHCFSFLSSCLEQQGGAFIRRQDTLIRHSLLNFLLNSVPACNQYYLDVTPDYHPNNRVHFIIYNSTFPVDVFDRIAHPLYNRLSCLGSLIVRTYPRDHTIVNPLEFSRRFNLPYPEYSYQNLPLPLSDDDRAITESLALYNFTAIQEIPDPTPSYEPPPSYESLDLPPPYSP